MSNKHYLLCVPFEGAQVHVVEVSAEESTDALEKRLMVRGSNGREYKLSEINHMRIEGGGDPRASAARLAEREGLRFIPPALIAGMRTRMPGITMKGIRTDFNFRMRQYEAAKAGGAPEAKKQAPKAGDFSAVVQRFMKDLGL